MDRREVLRAVLKALYTHPDRMSPVLFEHLLRGATIGRMAEKGLLGSPHFGVLAHLPEAEVSAWIQEVLANGWAQRARGFYPAMCITREGEAALTRLGEPIHTEASPEPAFRAYHAWRARLAREMRKPAYRVVPNATLNALALRRPTNLAELLEVPGIGKRRALRYHDALVVLGRELRHAG